MSSLNDYFKNGGSYADDIEELRTEMAQLSAVFTGQYVFMPPRAGSANVALVEPRGTILNRTAYPQLWTWAQTQTGLVVDDAAWLAIKAASPINACALYSSGDGSTTFRVPDMGNGGFSRFLGTAIPGDMDEGFGSLANEHQHATIISDVTGAANRPGFLMNTSGNTRAFGSTTLGNTESSGYTGAAAIPTSAGASTHWGSYTPNANNIVALTSRTVFNQQGEGHPQGDYKRLFIYTGNQTSFLPTPTPDWLNQQATNTAAIATIAAYPTPWIVIGEAGAPPYLNSLTPMGNALGLRYRFETEDTIHVLGSVSGSINATVNCFNFPTEIGNRINVRQFAPMTGDITGTLADFQGASIVQAGGQFQLLDNVTTGVFTSVHVDQTIVLDT